MKLFKKVFNKKFIGILLAVVILFNVISPNIVTPKVYAIDVAGILLYPLTFLIAMLAEGALAIINLVANQIDPNILNGNNLFINYIVYNKIPLFNANIFADTSTLTGSAITMGATTTMLKSIQKWYVITRTIAIAASFVILVYVAIKILISTAAGDKAKYKSLLKDWLLSLLLIFTMHFLMAGILFAADSLTEAIENIANSASSGTDVYEFMQGKALAGTYDSLIYAIMIWVLIIITFAFVIIYAKRVIMIAFLTVFAPLVALSYSIDKIKDGQSQILDKWMKEYIYTALMMPLDAMLYTVLSDTLMACLTGGNIIFGIALIIGYLPLRGWFNEFLGTDKAGHGMAGVAAGAVMGNAISKMAGGSNKKDGGQSTSNENKGQDGNNAVDGADGRGHEIETKASPNPMINGGADKPKVSSPTSAAASAGSLSSTSNETAGQRAIQARQARKENLKNTLSAMGKGSAQLAGKAYGKGLGMVAGATAGVAMTALTGNAAAGIGTGIGITKAANKGSEYGLGGKAAVGTAKVATNAGSALKTGAIGAADIAMGIGSGINNMRDRAMVGGLVNAMAENGVLDDIEDEEERAAATQWAIENTSDELFEDLYYQVERGEIKEKEMDDIMFREAIKANKGEIKQNLADERMATRVDRKAEYKERAKAAGQAVLHDGYSNADAKETERAARKRGRSDFKDQNKSDNSVMAAKKKEIKSRKK